MFVPNWSRESCRNQVGEVPSYGHTYDDCLLLSQFRACDLLIGLTLVPDIPELVGFRSVKSLYEATSS